MEIIYLPKADKDLSYWVKSGNKPILKKIAKLTGSNFRKPTARHRQT